MGRFDGKSVLISGAARGQGRAHAVAFAAEGADVAIFDICAKLPSTAYAGTTREELDETARLCEAEGARAVVGVADVRDAAAVESFVDGATQELGKIDIVVANAGILNNGDIATMDPETFSETIDVNLVGVFNTIRPVLPGMIERKYGRVIATGSITSIRGFAHLGHYTAAKHGVAGLIKSIAREVGDYGVTANYIVPNTVNTTMLINDAAYAHISPQDPTAEAMGQKFAELNVISKPWIEPEDVSKVVLFAASDDARYTTGSMLSVDLGITI
jgi:SDR family mycofactocin-dependent oxidoreductase